MQTGILLLLGALAIGAAAPSQQTAAPKAPPIGPRSQATTYKLVADFHEALTRCIQTGCTNIDDLVSFFLDEGSRTVVGGEVERGRAAIRAGLLKRAEKLPEVTYVLQGIDVSGPLVVCRVDRTTASPKGRFTLLDTRHDVHVLLVKDGRIAQLIVIAGPKEE